MSSLQMMHTPPHLARSSAAASSSPASSAAAALLNCRKAPTRDRNELAVHQRSRTRCSGRPCAADTAAKKAEYTRRCVRSVASSR